MAEIIAIVGESGTGKTRSIKSLPKESSFLITVSGKLPSYVGWMEQFKDYNLSTKQGNFFQVGNYTELLPVKATGSRGLLRAISEDMPHIKNIIIDDFQYIMGFEFMDRAYEKSYDKFTEIGKHAFDIVRLSMLLRKDLNIFFLCHEETVNKPNGSMLRKIKTIGRMLDDKITLEGLFNFVLFTEVKKEIGKERPDYYFITQNDGSTTGKSVEGVLEYRIPNDLLQVSKAIFKYRGINF